LSSVDWAEVGAAAQDIHAQFGLATPWQLRLAASQVWADSLFFDGFEHIWGADILGDLEPDEVTLLRQLTRMASEHQVEKLPMNYLTCEDAAIARMLHDTQNTLLNASLRAELYARLVSRQFDLPGWTSPDRRTPEPERVEAVWRRWHELTAHYARIWHQVKFRTPDAD
jgi:hypothetical protein